MAGTLTPYRRHSAKCPHKAEGKAWKRCACPVWIEGTWRGAYVRQSANTRSWEMALQAIRGLELDPARAAVTVADAIAANAADLEARRVAPATRKKYRQMADRLTTYCGRRGVRNVDELTTAFLTDFRATWQVSPVTANKMLERLRAFCGWCQAMGYLASNPASGLKRAIEDTYPTLPFSEDELTAIWRVLDAHRAHKAGDQRWNAERLRALVLVLRHTGVRIQDAVMLTRAQVADGRIVLRTAKTGTHVSVVVPGEVTEALEFIARPGRARYFAPDQANGETVAGNWRRRLRWLFREAGVDGGHAHRFRDTFAVQLLDSGATTEEVAAILGHSDPRITARHYSPWVKSRQKRLDEAVVKSWHQLERVVN